MDLQGEEIVHSFSLSYDIKTASNGVITKFNTQSDSNNISINDGKLHYKSSSSTRILRINIVNNDKWSRVTITHYYALGKTFLYIDDLF